MKTCKKCLRSKLESEYYVRSTGQLYAQCKLCMRNKDRNWYETHKDEKKRQAREWAEKHPEKVRASYTAYNQANADSLRNKASFYRQTDGIRVKAHKAVAYAVRTGKLVRPDRCSRCNKICKPQAHHEDYTKPLEVIWFCRTCHMLRHGGSH